MLWTRFGWYCKESHAKFNLESITPFYPGRLSCVDIAEVNPTLGNEHDKEITVNAALQIISRCFGNRRQGIYPKDYIFPCPTHLDCGRIDWPGHYHKMDKKSVICTEWYLELCILLIHVPYHTIAYHIILYLKIS